MKLSKEIVETLLVPGMVVFVACVFGVVGGAYWGVIDYLRNFGSSISLCPYFDHLQVAALPFRAHTAGSFLGAIEDLINCYNLAFPGATRFGSGLGLIGGAFWALRFARGRGLLCRCFAGVAGGVLIGARAALMLGSGAGVFLVGLVSGGLLTTLYMIFGAREEQIASWTLLELSQVPAAGQKL